MNKDSFAPVAALLMLALGSALSLVLAIINASAVSSASSGIYSLGGDVLFVVVGALNIAATVFAVIAVILSRKNARFNVLLPIVGAPFALSFLVGMIGGVMRSWQYTQVVEILYFIFILVAALAFAGVCVGFVTRKKSFIALFGLAVISVACAFVPVITGNAYIVDAIMNYIPSCVIIAAIAVLAVGTGKADTTNEKEV